MRRHVRTRVRGHVHRHVQAYICTDMCPGMCTELTIHMRTYIRTHCRGRCAGNSRAGSVDAFRPVSSVSFGPRHHIDWSSPPITFACAGEGSDYGLVHAQAHAHMHLCTQELHAGNARVIHICRHNSDCRATQAVLDIHRAILGGLGSVTEVVAFAGHRRGGADAQGCSQDQGCMPAHQGPCPR